jgi:hypothetical protein
MLTGQQRSMRRIVGVVLLATFMFVPLTVSAQDSERPSIFAETLKRVVFDPTTYAPAILSYDSTMRDWKSSQPFFLNGFVEHNNRFTISGRSDDVAVSYGVGKQRILADALATLEMSAVNNLTDSLIERVLIERHPEHRKLFRTLGWIEKVTFASYMSYQLSSQHYRQWQQNEARASQLGLR